MKNKRLKKPVVYSIYALSFVLLFGAVFLLESISLKNQYLEIEGDYVNKTIFDIQTPVVTQEKRIIRPYSTTNITLAKNYYDYKGETSNQESSILYYENTYLPNSGISYSSSELFDVIAIYDGEVTKIMQDELLGNIIEITHENNMISIYQSLGDVLVAKNQLVSQGELLGHSGTCNIQKDLNNHLHFELIINGNIVNPESYYDKAISEI